MHLTRGAQGRNEAGERWKKGGGPPQDDGQGGAARGAGRHEKRITDESTCACQTCLLRCPFSEIRPRKVRPNQAIWGLGRLNAEATALARGRTGGLSRDDVTGSVPKRKEPLGQDVARRAAFGRRAANGSCLLQSLCLLQSGRQSRRATGLWGRHSRARRAVGRPKGKDELFTSLLLFCNLLCFFLILVGGRIVRFPMSEPSAVLQRREPPFSHRHQPVLSSRPVRVRCPKLGEPQVGRSRLRTS